MYNEALSAFREFSEISRSSERLVIPNGQRWDVHQDGVKVGEVINYSSGGICVDIPNYYGNKVAVKMDLIICASDDGKVLHELRDLHAVVRWGKKHEKNFRHGLTFSEESSSKFASIGRTFLG